MLCEKNGKHDYEKDVDEDPLGEFSAGDSCLFSEPEYDNNGKKIGKSGGRGVVIRTLGEQDALIAFNVYLAGNDEAAVKDIAWTIRESSGGLPALRAIGFHEGGMGDASVPLRPVGRCRPWRRRSCP